MSDWQRLVYAVHEEQIADIKWAPHPDNFIWKPVKAHEVYREEQHGQVSLAGELRMTWRQWGLSGFGATVEAAYADLLRQEAAAERAKNAPDTCKLVVRD